MPGSNSYASFCLSCKLSAGCIYVFAFTMADVDDHIAALQKFYKFITVFFGTVTETGSFHIVIFYQVDFNRKLFAIIGQCFGIVQPVVYVFQ